MIYITGDTHAALNNESGLYKKGHKLRKDFIKSLNPNDILIVLGDFGYTWTPDILKQYSCPAITLVVDGNHDNFTYLNLCPKIEMFGSEVGVIKDNVYRLLSGNIYSIEGIKTFIFGGALSIDKSMRIPYKSWWPEEIPSTDTYKKALSNLESNNYDIDLFLAHTCSEDVCDKFFKYSYKIQDPVEKMLSELEFNIKYNNPDSNYKYMFGHHHTFRTDGEYFCLYNQVLKLYKENDELIAEFVLY